MNVVCPICGGTLVPARVTQDTWTGERRIAMEVDAQHCTNCGEDLIAGIDLRDAQDRANAITRREDGLLGPAEIQAIRARYGLSQDAFERLIRAGQKTVTRWERGIVCQTGTADTLMRVLRDNPAVTAALAAERGVTLKPPADAAPRPAAKAPRRKAA
jgi:HTH-type transcriptional regulator/antitoxin MqsA